MTTNAKNNHIIMFFGLPGVRSFRAPSNISKKCQVPPQAGENADPHEQHQQVM